MRPTGPRRRAARVIVLDPQDRILLINARDPIRPRSSGWWEIPGGGMDPGERSEETARRELWEEAGITDAEVGPCVWTQTVRFTFAGLHFDQDEWIHIARCDGTAAPPGGLEALEALAFGEQRWWHAEQLLASGVRTIPYRLAEFLPALLDGAPPSAPIDVTPDDSHIRAWEAG